MAAPAAGPTERMAPVPARRVSNWRRRCRGGPRSEGGVMRALRLPPPHADIQGHRFATPHIHFSREVFIAVAVHFDDVMTFGHLNDESLVIRRAVPPFSVNQHRRSRWLHSQGERRVSTGNAARRSGFAPWRWLVGRSTARDRSPGRRIRRPHFIRRCVSVDLCRFWRRFGRIGRSQSCQVAVDGP